MSSNAIPINEDTKRDKTVTIYEVGPRDGLQSLGQHVPTATKVALIHALSQAGFTKIEATSFVNPNWVPQLADAADVMATITRQPGVKYAALAPNLRGAKAALAAQCDEVAIFVSASEGFSQANTNCSIGESFRRIAPVIEQVLASGVPVRGYLSCVVECPFDGPTDPVMVADLSQRLLSLGCYEVSLGDTLGTATPTSTKPLLHAVFEKANPSLIAGHFHDTYGNALSNIETCLEFGVRTFDSSISGLGGCPYAPGASGNVDTRAVVTLLHDLGYESGVDLSALKKAETIARATTAAA
ncbi:MAG: hydroxymethylglutaryl-CoA lyase [Pseudomonadota bacterium]